MSEKIDKFRIIMFITLFMAICLFSLIFMINSLLAIKEDIGDCKHLGYDGVKFVNKLSSEVECANFTDLERLRRESKK